MTKYKLKKLHKYDAHNNEVYTKDLYKETYKKVSEGFYRDSKGEITIFSIGTKFEKID